jgi:DNA-binding response OmpR family regulator
MKARLLWIEGKRADSPSFVPSLRKKEYLIEVVPTGSAALERLLDYDPDLAVINASSLRTSGKHICHELHEKAPGLPILVILSATQTLTYESCASVVLTMPFTARKLINRINRLLPGDGDNILHVGHFRLDLERKRVRCLGRETRLTPRMVRLLQVLMQHPGMVVERAKLFASMEHRVHRRYPYPGCPYLVAAGNAEEDPRKPQFLKTIRGVGYRLDV